MAKLNSNLFFNNILCKLIILIIKIFSKAVKKLISEGADVNQRSKDGMTALSIAAFWGYADIAKALLENGYVNIKVVIISPDW